MAMTKPPLNHHGTYVLQGMSFFSSFLVAAALDICLQVVNSIRKKSDVVILYNQRMSHEIRRRQVIHVYTFLALLITHSHTAFSLTRLYPDVVDDNNDCDVVDDDGDCDWFDYNCDDDDVMMMM